MTIYYGIYYGHTLEHHGVKGMKWGVRRYQNYDGSLTKKGLEQYKEAEANYYKKEEAYNKVKRDKNISKETKQLLKGQKKQAKKELSKSYDNLKARNDADEGRRLYLNGKRIGTNKRIAYALAYIGAFSLSSAKAMYDSGGKASTVNALTAIGALSYGAALTKYAINAKQNRQLNAYYTRPYK